MIDFGKFCCVLFLLLFCYIGYKVSIDIELFSEFEVFGLVVKYFF